MRRNAGALLILALAVGACAGPHARVRPCAPSPAAERYGYDPASDEVLSQLRYYASLQSLPPAQLDAEFRRAQTAFLQDKTPSRRLHLALLLSLPNAHFGNPAAASALLKEYLHAPDSDAPLRLLAYLLVSDLDKRADLQQRTSTLSRQLDELKSIERTLNRRDNAAGPP